MGRYRINLLGGLELLRPDGRKLVGLGRKHMALVAYLAAEPGGASRAELAALLWPGKPDARARHNLRMAISALRRSFGADFERVFHEEQEHLQLLPELVRVDLREFAAAAADDPATGASSDLPNGRVLDGVRPPTKEFANWATTLASRFEAQRAERAARLGGGSAAGDRSPPGRRPARRQRGMVAMLAIAFSAVALTVYLLMNRGDETLDRSLTGERGFASAPSISVLPFKFTGDDPDGYDFASGLSEEVTSALTIVSDILVVRPGAIVSAASPEARQAFGVSYNVRFVLSGEVERAGDRLRVAATLFDTRPPGREWRYEFDRPWGEPFSLQTDLARSILSELDIELSSAEWSRIDLIGDTADVDAWLEAVAGLRHLIRINRADNEMARRRYQAALLHDPGYVSALRGLAWTHFLDVRLGWTAAPRESLAKADALVRAALAKAPEDGMAHSLAGALLLLAGDHAAAVAEGERSVALLPNSADASAVLAHTLTYVGKTGRAIDLLRQAIRLSPRHPDWYRWSLGRALRLDGQVKAAVRELEKGDGAPDAAVVVHLVELALAYAADNRIADARRIGLRILTTYPNFSSTSWLSHPAIVNQAAQTREFELMVACGLPE